jgi:hypothetical protein
MGNSFLEGTKDRRTCDGVDRVDRGAGPSRPATEDESAPLQIAEERMTFNDRRSKRAPGGRRLHAEHFAKLELCRVAADQEREDLHLADSEILRPAGFVDVTRTGDVADLVQVLESDPLEPGLRRLPEPFAVDLAAAVVWQS